MCVFVCPCKCPWGSVSDPLCQLAEKGCYCQVLTFPAILEAAQPRRGTTHPFRENMEIAQWRMEAIGWNWLYQSAQKISNVLPLLPFVVLLMNEGIMKFMVII